MDEAPDQVQAVSPKLRNGSCRGPDSCHSPGRPRPPLSQEHDRAVEALGACKASVREVLARLRAAEAAKRRLLARKAELEHAFEAASERKAAFAARNTAMMMALAMMAMEDLGRQGVGLCELEAAIAGWDAEMPRSILDGVARDDAAQCLR